MGLLKVSRLEARGGGTLKGVPIRGVVGLWWDS